MQIHEQHGNTVTSSHVCINPRVSNRFLRGVFICRVFVMRGLITDFSSLGAGLSDEWLLSDESWKQSQKNHALPCEGRLPVWIAFSCEYRQKDLKSFDDYSFWSHSIPELSDEATTLLWFLLTGFWDTCTVKDVAWFRAKIILSICPWFTPSSQRCWMWGLTQLIQSRVGVSLCFIRGQILPAPLTFYSESPECNISKKTAFCQFSLDMNSTCGFSHLTVWWNSQKLFFFFVFQMLHFF